MYCLLGLSRPSEKKIHYCMEIITYDPSIYAMDHPGIHVTVSNFMENYIGLKRVNDLVMGLEE